MRSTPVRFEDFWDMNIPTEYYEEEFIEFEKYLNCTGSIRVATKESPHANSEYQLKRYKKYEKWMKKQNKKKTTKINTSNSSKIETKSHKFNESQKEAPFQPQSSVAAKKEKKTCKVTFAPVTWFN